ncbi:MAG TPA: UPF0164 family protein, partial [bacterium]|nr:UPF0164 family protein [bacterium]
MKKIVIVTLLLLTAAGLRAGDVAKVGVTAAPFLSIGVGARATGMGGAFVGTADDASALYWNPAGIARSGDIQLLLMHTRWLA